MRTGCNDGLWQRLSICKPLATLGSNYQQQHPQIWSKWVIMTAYGSVYLCKLFVPLWSILCRDHFHTKFLSLTSCSTYQACSSVKITQILHQNVGSQRRPWCFFQRYVFKASYPKLWVRKKYQQGYLKIFKKIYIYKFFLGSYFSLVSLLFSILMKCNWGLAADQWQASPHHRVDLSPQNTLLICSWRPSNLKKIWKRKCTQASYWLQTISFLRKA